MSHTSLLRAFVYIHGAGCGSALTILLERTLSAHGRINAPPNQQPLSRLASVLFGFDIGLALVYILFRKPSK